MHDATRPTPAVADDERRPRLLFLSTSLPYPPDEGAHIRTYNIMRLLARSYDLTALCFYRKGSRSTRDAVEYALEELRKFAEAYAFPIPQDRGRLRLIWDHIRSLVMRRVYTRFTYASKPYGAALQEVLETSRFSVVHVDSLDLSAHLPAVRHLPVVCTHHNVESALLRRRAHSLSFPLRSYAAYQARLMEAEEKRWCGRVDLNVAVSPADARLLRAQVPASRVSVVPNGVDTRHFRPGASETRGLVFVGGASWFPNRDAMEYFAAEVLPLIRQRSPGVTMTWVGRCEEAVRRRFEQEHGMRVTGFVDDTRPFVEEAACYVVPLRVGGGTRLKILEGWAMGKAIVSTSLGCEGLEARDGRNILVRDGPRALAEGVSLVLGDPRLRDRLGAEGRRTAVGRYDWEVVAEEMLPLYAEVGRTED